MAAAERTNHAHQVETNTAFLIYVSMEAGAILHALIIEDEPLVAMMIEDALLECGATSVAIAVTEDEAIEAAKIHRPDFITSDVALLEGTGPAAVNDILARLGDIPVLFITATPHACKPCAPPGSIMVKPFTTAGVRQEFRRLTGR